MAIAKLRGFELPCFAMTGALANQCVGNLVKQHLLDCVHVRNRNKVFAHGDASLGVIAKTCPPDSSVKTKGVVDQTMFLKKTVC